MPDELIDFWGRCGLATQPLAHPDDLSILRQKRGKFIDADQVSFDTLMANRQFRGFDDRFHLSLLPTPYLGDLRHAEIVIMQLNPGLEYTDYWAESKMPHFRNRLEHNLRQSFGGVEFPFLFLDPQFCWHTGFLWWEEKLRQVTSAIAESKFNGSYFDALRDLSTKLACVELIAYHSSSFRAHILINQLPSAKQALRFVRHSLVPDAETGKRTLIITRQVRTWGLPSGIEGLVMYDGGQSRGASLSPNSSGGKAILRRYGIFL
jgi:hypothetical protein